MAGVKDLYSGRPTTANTTLVAAQATKYWLKSIFMHNNTAVDAQVTLNRVPSAGAAGLDNEFFNGKVPANGHVQITDFDDLEIGQTIQGLQTTAGAVSVFISGPEVV